MNYVYERDYAVLVRLKVPADAQRHGADPRRGALARLHRQDLRARAGRALARPSGRQRDAEPRAVRRMAAGACRGRWRPPAISQLAGDKLRVADPASGERRGRRALSVPDRPTASSIMRRRRRSAAPATRWSPSCKRKGATRRQFAGVLALGDGRGLEFQRGAGRRSRRRNAARRARREGACCWAVLGAIAGGILLNLMPCVFPILALKALHISRAGGEAARGAVATRWPTRRARSSAPARSARAARDPRGGSARPAGRSSCRTRARSCCCCCSRSRSPPTCSACSSCRCSAGARSPAGSFGTGALAAFVATPCAGPFLGAALGTALLLPLAGSVAGVRRARAWASRCRSCWSPSFRRCGAGCRSPGRGWTGCSASSRSRWRRPRSPCLWLLYRQGGQLALLVGLVAAAVARALLLLRGRPLQRDGQAGWLCRGARCASSIAGARVAALPTHRPASARVVAGAEPWSEARVASYARAGQAGVRLFHRRLVPDLQGQRGRGDRPRRSPRRVQARPA